MAVSVGTLVISKVVSVVVVWLASDWLIALRCSLFRFCLLWSVAIHGGFTPFGPAAVSVSQLSLRSRSPLSTFHVWF